MISKHNEISDVGIGSMKGICPSLYKLEGSSRHLHCSLRFKKAVSFSAFGCGVAVSLGWLTMCDDTQANSNQPHCHYLSD